MKDVPSRRRHICLFCCHAELLHVACHIVTACGIFIHFNLNNLKILTANGKRLTTNCSLRFEVNANLKVSNNEHSLTSPEQKCTGEFGTLAGDKSPSLPGTTNRGLWKV